MFSDSPKRRGPGVKRATAAQELQRPKLERCLDLNGSLANKIALSGTAGAPAIVSFGFV